MMQPTSLRGFTLIEILVVVVIISITIGVALFAFGDFGRERRLLMAGEQFFNYLKLIQHEAIIETASMGICVENQSYRVLRLTNNQWSEPSHQRIFLPHRFPSDVVITLNSSLNHNKCPQITVDSAGDVSTFKLYLGSSATPHLISITGHHDNGLTLERPTS